jgi:hypothetical protein
LKNWDSKNGVQVLKLRPDCGFLHLFEDILVCYNDWGLFNDLLMTPLDGTVSTEDRDGSSFFVGKKLNFQVTCIGGKFHDENWGTGHFKENLEKTNILINISRRPMYEKNKNIFTRTTMTIFDIR